MSDYSILLKSGDCLDGSVDDQTKDKMIDTFLNSKKMLIFDDTDGKVFVIIKDISALTIYNQSTKEEIGFD